MDALRDRPAGVDGQLVQHIEGGPEQGFRDQPPIDALPVLTVVQLDHEITDVRGPGFGSGRRLKRCFVK